MSLAWILLLAFVQLPEFTESFDFGFSHPWEVHDAQEADNGPSNWRVENGVLFQSARIIAKGASAGTLQGTRLVLPDQSHADGTLLARISARPEGGVGLLFRVRDAEHYYRLSIHPDPETGAPAAALHCRDGVDWVEVARGEPAPSVHYGPWWMMAVEMQDNRFRALLDGETLLEAQNERFQRGGVGLSTFACGSLRVDAIAFYPGKLDPAALTPTPALLKGPTLGCLSPTGFTAAWETSRPCDSLLEVSDESGTRRLEGPPGKRRFHEVHVTDLQPASSIGYKVVSDPIESPLYRIRLPSANSEQLRFCIYGGSHSNSDPHRYVIRSMVRKTPDLVLHTGGLVAEGDRYENWLPEFFDPASWMIHTVPFYVSPATPEQGSTWFDALLPLPGNKRFYSFTHGRAFFVALDTTQALTNESDQIAWLEKTLDSEEARSAAWRFCFFHHPAHSESGIDYKPSADLGDTVLPLLERGGIDILFTGHVCNYERGQLNNVYHIVTAGGGAPLCFGDDYRVRDVPHITVTRSVLHACLVEIDGRTLRLSAFTPDGKPFDTFTIQK